VVVVLNVATIKPSSNGVGVWAESGNGLFGVLCAEGALIWSEIEPALHEATMVVLFVIDG
jgi:hypothetical protein